MATENDQLQYSDILESFDKEVERYKPKDMIDFCDEYFKCLQKGIPLRYKDLSGLDKFHLKPEDEEVIKRLNIPDEDLVRVINRRKIITQEEILNKLNSEFDRYSELYEKEGQLSDEDMHNYLKLKTNTFRDYEFIRFLKDIEKVPIDKNNYRIFFTKLYDLSDEEKKLIFKFCDLDYKITKEKKIQSWKERLDLLNDCNKHTYAPYDDVSPKLEKDLKLFDEKGEKIILKDLESIFSKYNETIENLKKMQQNELYNFILGQYQYKRVILYDILRAKILGESPDRAELEPVLRMYEDIFYNSFIYLTDFDYFDYILSCFIPLIKDSDKTSLEHREMESYLNHLIAQIPQIYNINFEEEKNLYYNIECVKYFLNKQNNILTAPFKKTFIEIIELFCKKIKTLKEELNLKSNREIWEKFGTKFELIKLQKNEFYPKLVDFTEKIIQIAINYDLDGSNKEIANSLISQFKSYEKSDQELIKKSMEMAEIFESDKIKQKGIKDTVIALDKAMSIPEMAQTIRENESKDGLIIPKTVSDYYNNILKQPRFDFNNLKYLSFKNQVQIVNLIIRNNRNLQNTAIIYQNNNITPYIDYDYMIEELFNFDLFYFKICFDDNMKDQLLKDLEHIVIKFKKKFPKISEYIVSILKPNEADTNETKAYIEQFKKFNNFEQKLILTYMNFSDDLFMEKKYNPYLNDLSVIYLNDKIEFIKKKFTGCSNNNNNILYMENLYNELKHVNYRIYIFVKYDRSEDILVKFNKEEKEIIKNIENALGYKKTKIPTECLSLDEMLSTDDYEKLLNDLKEYHPCVYEYVTEFKDGDNIDNLVTDLKLFNSEERQVILKILEHDGKQIGKLKGYHENAKDELSRIFKHIMLCEKDSSLNKPEGFDIRFFYRKLLLANEKLMNPNLKNFVSLILEHTFDPNNTYLRNNFLEFPLSEQMIFLQDILCRLKIIDKQTMYYEQCACAFIEKYIKIYLDIVSRRNGSPNFHKRLESDFEYLLKFFNDSVGEFVKGIQNVDNQSIYQFLNNFSLEERKVICYFLELYSALTQNEKYTQYKTQLEAYSDDLTYNDRLDIINKQLDMIINNEAMKSTFMVTAENIKETAYEVNYLIESICQLDDNVTEVEPYLMYLYETFSMELREITLKTIKCIREQNTNKIIGIYYDEFEKKKDSKVRPSIFISIKEAFAKIEKTLIPNHDNSEKKPKYDKLKVTLQSLCEDLFRFVDDCKIGRFSLRKIKAISKEKIEVIQLVLACDNAIQPNKKLKNAIQSLSLMIDSLKLKNNK